MMGIRVGLIGDRGGDILSIASKYTTNGLALRQWVEVLKSLVMIKLMVFPSDSGFISSKYQVG